MEDNNKKDFANGKDKDIFFSKVLKAGKRIYYLDVKKNRNGELFLAITESKRVTNAEQSSDGNAIFEKHKVFLYKEDFDKFTNGINEVIGFIRSAQKEINEPQKKEKELEVKTDNTRIL